MKNNTGLLLLGLVGAGAFFLFRKTESAKQLQTSIDDIAFDLKKLTLSVKVRVVNPGNASVDFNSIAGTVVYNKEEIGLFSYLTPTVIGSRKTVNFWIPIKLNMLPFGKVITEVLTTRKLSKVFGVNANIVTSLGTVNISQTVNASIG